MTSRIARCFVLAIAPCLVWSVFSFGPLAAAASDDPRGEDPADIATFPRPATLDDVLALPDDRIDLGYAALLIEQSLFRRTRPATLAAKIDQIAREIAPRVATRRTPRAKLRALAWHLFVRHGFRTYGTGTSGRAHAFTATLDRGRGVCFGLSVLVTAVAQRLRMPVRIAEIPGHVFVRYDDGTNVVNLETTRRGRRESTRYYLEEYGLSDERFVRILSERESIALFLIQTAGALFEVGRPARGRAAIERALEIDPKNPRAWYKMGLVHESDADGARETAAYRRSLSLRSDDPVVWAALGVAERDAGEHGKAARSFRSMTKIDAKSPTVWILTGDALLRDRAMDRATECYRRALARDDARRRDAERLARRVERAIAASPDGGDDERPARTAAMHVRLAAAQFSLGRQGAVVEALKRAPSSAALIVRRLGRDLERRDQADAGPWIFAALASGAIGDTEAAGRYVREATRRGATIGDATDRR